MTNILNPNGGQNFPYWPGLGVQVTNSIPGAQMAGEVVDIRLNKDRYSLPYTSADVSTLRTAEALQDKSGAARFIEGQPVMGRGAGQGLTDMLLTSIAQQQKQAGE